MDRDKLEQMLLAGSDNVMLRYALASQLLKEGLPDEAIVHLETALNKDPSHSASWKLLGKALTAAGQIERAKAIYRNGIAVAERRKDMQAVKEMNVFLKRLEKQSATD